MGQYPGQTKHIEMDIIEQRIRESIVPKRELSTHIMNKIGENGENGMNSRTMRTSKAKPSIFKKTAIAAAVAAVLGAGTIVAGFVSPAMADTLKKIPGIGLIYQGTSPESVDQAIAQGILSEPAQSVTHGGNTLKLTNLLYDGTRLSFLLEYEGALDLSESSLGSLIEPPVFLADGQAIKFTKGMMGDVPYHANTYQAELTHGLDLPDEFALTIQAKMKQADEVFEFNVPVKLVDNAIVVKPDITKSDGAFSYTVDELLVTPVSTRLILHSQGEVPHSTEQTGEYSASKVYYELVDDEGNSLDPNIFGYYNSKPQAADQVNELYAAFAATTKSVTIKPFTLTVKNDDFSIVGQKKDSNGNLLPGIHNQGERTYLQDLEVTVPLQP
ncbi:DUF4179 domain-containing protein [Paenibacillus sp. MMS20-IR301]|uniref:DUF4179 domain-containing protein n=1 Tax=Paenibacillus sp. MMS20-IR301 TaxID=2895946 RepID=UPI0028EDF873|nr:DUF4179 domain-containing protein [Paenibacillus sp. MMS20-IR301]WNS43915.1 DUF4179 domain-containing protein [Paenibacillus sp. MMS20-IR301]